MAIIVGKEQKIPFSGAIKDSRAEGYVSYFTKAGWDRWKMAAASVERNIADRDKEYSAAVDMYNKQLKELADTKDNLAKKIADVQAKAAAADIKREDARWKAEEARQLQVQKQETEKAKGIAKQPSVGGSQRTSTSQRTGSSGGAGGGGRGGSGKDPYDEAMDEITTANRQLVDDRMRTLSGGLNSSNVGDRWTQLDQLNKAGSMPSDAYTRGMSAYTLYRNSLAALKAQSPSASEDDLKAALLQSLPPSLVTDVAYGQSMVDAKAAKQQGGGAGGGTSQGTSSSQGTSFSRGTYQQPYDIAAFDKEVADAEKLGVGYKQIEEDLANQLANVDKQKLKVPTFEKIDLINATRKTYDDKFGDIPKGTMLQTASGNTYKSELQPYELTNAIKQSEQFFKLYIDAEVKSASEAKGGLLNTDEQNAAVEAGKKRAREILFGGLGQRKPAQPSTNVPPKITDDQKRSADVILLGLEPDATDEEIRTAKNKQDDELKAALQAAKANTAPEAFISATQGESGGEPTSLPLPGLKTIPTRIPNRKAEFDALNFIPSTPSINAKETLPEFAPSTPYRSTGTPNSPLTNEERTKNIEDAVAMPGANPLGSLIQNYTPATPEGYRSPNQSYGKDTWKQEGYVEPTKEEIDSQLYWKNKRKEEQKTKPANSQDQESLNDRRIKTEAVIAGSSLAIENPKKAAATVTKDSIGKYVSSLYDTNKEKGANGQPVGKISEAILREYSNDPSKQKKALEILASLSVLDSSAGKIRAV